MKSVLKKTNRAVTLILAGAVLCTALSSCSSGGTNKSNPVAVDEFGEVDMEKALSYETDIDALIEKLEAKEVDPSKPVSENVNKKTLAVFNWLRENHGTKTILGQQMMNEKNYEDAVYYGLSEDLPAIKGFDLIFSTSSGDTSQIDRAIEWHTKSSGLVTLTWHWNVPRDIDNLSKGTAFYTEEITNFSLVNAVTPGTKEYEQIIHDIDLIAIQLQRLEEADVPVLWRPLHEASGSWFWWGGSSRDNSMEDSYKKLWYIIFDRLENYHKLTNLIWIWNGQNQRHSVSPNTYDISGTDIYPNSQDHTAQEKSYADLQKITAEGKMIALTECGYIPDIKDMKETGAMWLYCLPWYGDFVYASSGGGPVLDTDGLPSVNTEKMSEEFLKGFLEDENVITWKKMPKWNGTEKNVPENTDLLFKMANWSKDH